MKLGMIYRNGEPTLPHIWRTASTWESTRGLLGRPRLQDQQGLLIPACRMVHTFGMGYPLDLAFLDGDGRVCKTVQALKPARMAGSLSARHTLELAPGTVARLGLRRGDILVWRQEDQ